jgi:hypothetical protein
VAIAAKHIAKEPKGSGFIRNESYFMHDAGCDVGPQFESGKLKAMVAILTD